MPLPHPCAWATPSKYAHGMDRSIGPGESVRRGVDWESFEILWNAAKIFAVICGHRASTPLKMMLLRVS